MTVLGMSKCESLVRTPASRRTPPGCGTARRRDVSSCSSLSRRGSPLLELLSRRQLFLHAAEVGLPRALPAVHGEHDGSPAAVTARRSGAHVLPGSSRWACPFCRCSLTDVDRRVSAFLDEVAAWAGAQVDVRAVLLVGSQARVDAPADDFSDVDLGLFVDDPERYLRDDGWVRSFGEPLLSLLEPTAVGGFEERRVLFRDGFEVDFSILPAAIAKAPPPGAEAVLGRGFRVVYDDSGLDDFAAAGTYPAAPPTQASLEQLSNDFWYHVLWGAKKLRRGELLLANQVSNCYLTARLVELLRWRAYGHDTWHAYRFFERWAGGEVAEALGTTFARYEAADIARALRAKGELFGQLEHDVVQRFHLVDTVDRSEVLRRLDALLSS
jgi:aminoglycoside 6-adenylyltransferase